MPCSCRSGRSLLAKQDLPPEVERAVRDFFSEYRTAIDPIRRDLLDAIETGEIDPSSTSSVRTGVRRIAGQYTADIEVVFETGTERGVTAGRELAVRIHQLDIDFELVPERVLAEFDAWSADATAAAMSTLTDETTRYVRAAHEDGLSLDDLRDAINDDLFDGRLQDWQAERTARTATLSSSNAGSHSAYEDSRSVVAEEWLSAGDDGRTRETHLAADSQIVAVENTFLVGGHEARYPGDPHLPLEEFVQCRCVAIPVRREQLTDEQFAHLEAGGRLNAPA